MIERSASNNVLLAPVLQKIDSEYSVKRAEQLKLFARKYFASAANSLLANTHEEELFADVQAVWRFLQTRQSTTPKLELVHHTEQSGEFSSETQIFLLLNDMPFVIDSIRQCLNRMGAVVHQVNNTVVHCKRTPRKQGKGGKLQAIAANAEAGYRGEAISSIRCAYLSDEQCAAIAKEIKTTLKFVTAAVKDFAPMVERAEEVRQSLLANSDSLPVSQEELTEASEFIAWVINNHFTFLGYEQYRLTHRGKSKTMELQRESLLGVSRYKREIKDRAKLNKLPKGTAEVILRRQICSFAKSSIRSRVHRPAYYDYLLLKEFDSHGNVVVEHRFTGLYTSSVYYRPAMDIPLVRAKVRNVMERSGFSPNGHNSKDLMQVINAFPREELFQMSSDQLFDTAMEITRIQDTRTSKVFIRKDTYGKFFSCLVYVPRDIYTTRVRQRIQDFLQERLQASELDYNVFLSESMLARVHFILRVPEIHRVKYDSAELEQSIVTLVKPWEDYFLEALRSKHGEAAAHDLQGTYGETFSGSYKESYSGREAVADIGRIESVLSTGGLALKLSPCRGDSGAELRFKIFSLGKQLLLSDVDPILENLGLNIISEKTFKLQVDDEQQIWLHDFSLFRKHRNGKFDVAITDKFEDAFRAIWEGQCDDDAFNALVTTAGMHWRDVALLRAYAAYLKQIQFGYVTNFIAETLAQHQNIAQDLLQLFYVLFDPQQTDTNERASKRLRQKILSSVDEVVNLAEDSVLRAILELLEATLRSNFFQLDKNSEPKNYFSFKFNPQAIEAMPRPKPRFEIFVYSRQVEGVHLRGGKVARGGLRWSDRSEDYRTEVLGLVKAQQVKNAVIVPVGAKGGFIVRQPIPNADRKQQMEQGISCYKTFISGLLDLTDNIVEGEVVGPTNLKHQDEEDTYLVVAADKGTASFSDIANGVADDYNFWMGDGFASGGSYGYDHKAMGITAKGAWVSVQRHFRELGVNVQKEDFTVLGIGDMSGDVFGNGMLLSRHIRLVAAFNHRHIFIDPDPDAAASFKERQRLFKLQGSGWSDYDSKLISKGGGVFDRSAKSIALSKEMQECFAIDKDKLTPNQLIHELLKAPVDLIWNGGIGTYIKASDEAHSDVGDKANDALRVDGQDVRARVIGEGGNLGLTQRARIEYALEGGISVTDFVDNSAGVDCSDHEVNIKILLNRQMAESSLTLSKRNSLLKSMTKSVADLVLDNNYSQVQAISLASTDARVRHKEYADLIAFLEARAGLDRALEFLPTAESLEERAAKDEYLTRPELAVITSYMKMLLKSKLTEASFINDEYLESFLFSAFPQELVDKDKKAIRAHPLRRQIIATQIANTLVNLLGPSFIYRMVESTASSIDEVVRAALITRDAFAVDDLWSDLEALELRVSTDLQIEMMTRVIRLMRRATRWLLRNRRGNCDFSDEVQTLGRGIKQVARMLPAKLSPDYQQMFNERFTALVEQKVPEDIANRICQCDFIFSASSFVEIQQSTGESLAKVVDIYYTVGEELQLNWLGKIINQLPVNNYWQALARETYLDDLAWQQRALSSNVITDTGCSGSAHQQVEQWIALNEQALSRTGQILGQLQSEAQPDYAMFSVALRELLTLAQITASLTR